MLGLGEPCAKKSKIELRINNERRKEKPRKPQFSLNFQFDFGEKKVMKETQDRFVRLRNMAENLRPGHTNADFLTALFDANEGNRSRNAQRNQELHSVSANDQTEEKAIDCQGRPCEEAPSCRQLLSPADVNESFFVCGQDSLVVLLHKTARGCPCGSPFFFDGDNSVKKWMVMSYVWNFFARTATK